MFNFFKKEKKTEIVEQDDFSILDTEETDVNSLLDSLEYKDVPDLENCIPEIDLSNIDWNKQIVLLLDDNETVLYFLETDFIIFETLADKLNNKKYLTKVEEKLYERALGEGLMDFLLTFKKSNYEIIKISSAYAAFGLRKALKNIKRIDFAILDILLGGVIQDDETSKRLNLTGIDTAKDLIEHCGSKFCFYTGCDLGKYSPESLIFNKLFPNMSDLRNFVIPKDMDLTERRLEILRLLANKELKGVAPNEK